MIRRGRGGTVNISGLLALKRGRVAFGPKPSKFETANRALSLQTMVLQKHPHREF